MKQILTGMLLVVGLVVGALGQSTILWDEALNGPMSEDFEHPTALAALQSGTNSLFGVTAVVTTPPNWAGHPKFFTISVPTGLEVRSAFLQMDKPSVWTWIGGNDFYGEIAFTGNAANGDLLNQWGLSNLVTGGYGMYFDNHDHSDPVISVANFRVDFVVQAIPEPASLWLLLGGLGCLGFHHWRKTRLNKVARISLVLVAFTTLPCCTRGEVLFETFGANGSFDSSSFSPSSWFVSPLDPLLNVSYGIAARFELGNASASLDSVSMALASVSGALGETNLAISLVADKNGAPEGPVLETLVTHPTNIGADTSPRVLSYSSSLHPLLAAGQSFWLIAQPADINVGNSDDNSTFGWFNGVSPGQFASRFFDFDNGNWGNWQATLTPVLPAFRIEGTIIPEPASLWLLLGGLGCFGLARLKPALVSPEGTRRE